jgi:hypothetical protein
MSLLLFPLLAAVLAAMLLSRSLTAWAREPVHWWPLAVLAIPADLILARIPVTQAPWLIDWGHWLWVATLLLMVAVFVRNAIARRGWRGAPWAMAALGTGLNLVVIFANGGYMPVDAAALDATGMSAELSNRPRYRSNVLITAETPLPFLADVIIDPGWLPRQTVLSVGDLVLVAGLAAWPLVSARRPRLAPGQARAPGMV